MTLQRRNLFISLFFFGLALASVLGMGAIRAWHRFEIRGIPAGLPEPINFGGTQLGINAYLDQYNDEELKITLDGIAATGATAVKQPFYFSENFDWQASDRILAAIEEHDLDIVPLLDGDPETNFAPPSDPDNFAEWAGDFALRYGSIVDYYIIWDEPNLTSHWGNQRVNPAEYGAILRSAAGAIKTSDSEATIVAAPLAPTTETNSKNLADPLYLQALYEAGTSGFFDIAAAKPYGFNDSPMDRTVDLNVLNFSRVILLREIMEKNGDQNKALWAGNWGWNSLPQDWAGTPSIWGQIDQQTQAHWTVDALTRARREWPWMGLMFLENWEPLAEERDPRWGFSIAGRSTEMALQEAIFSDRVANPGFHLASLTSLPQHYIGDWRFSPDYGADVSNSGDEVSFTFWGTEAGLRVRKADYNARFYVTIDELPANALPKDEQGSVLVLNPSDPVEDYIAIELVASGLSQGEHIMSVAALRGKDQWALNGFSVGYSPTLRFYKPSLAILGLIAMISAILSVHFALRADWGVFGLSIRERYERIGKRGQAAATAGSAAIVAITGFLTWGEQVAGLYRRVGDGGQLALTAAAASLFYLAPSFFLYLLAMVILFVLLYLRPAWGLALVAFSIPYYVNPKPLLGYRFSRVEIFLLMTLLAFVATLVVGLLQAGFPLDDSWRRHLKRKKFKLKSADLAVLALMIVATLSLLVTERLDVATNEWRVVVIEPIIFYFLLRLMPLQEKEMWTVIDAFILGGLVVAIIGLAQYIGGQNLITSEGGLMRLRSIYGSPNNVALYLGRLLPIVLAVALMGIGNRRFVYGLALVPISFAILLTFSKGALFLGLPVSILIVIVLWLRVRGRPVWPWLLGAGILTAFVLIVASQIPQLAGRLNPQGTTGLFRFHLWLAAVNMFLDHPILGVGLDNFLYAYRGRYIFEAAWQEPNLSHPHNIVLDFATRLGLLGLVAGAWMIWAYWRTAYKLPVQVSDTWKPIAIGLLGSLAYILLHGLVDHSFFLVDLAYSFLLLLAIAVWLEKTQIANPMRN